MTLNFWPHHHLSTCANKMRVWFTILFYPKTITPTTFNTIQKFECLLGLPPSFGHNMTTLNFKSTSIQPKVGENWRTRPINPVCMLRLSINSYLDDTAHELSWSKLFDFSVQTFLKLIIWYKITSQTTAQSYLCRNRLQNGQFFSKNIVQTSKNLSTIMEKVETVFLLHDVIKNCVESYWKQGI